MTRVVMRRAALQWSCLALALALLAGCDPVAVEHPPGGSAPSPPVAESVRPSGIEPAPASLRYQGVGSCNIEGLAPSHGDTGGTLHLQGWVLDPGTKLRPGGIWLHLRAADGGAEWRIAVRGTVQRPDVAAAFGTPTAVEAGIDERLPLDGLPSGDYRLFLGFETSDGYAVCDNGRTLRWTP